MKTTYASIVAVAVTFMAHNALACSYAINTKAKGAELAKVAEAAVQGEGGSEVQTEVQSVKYFESKPTPMCPDEMTYNSEIKASYRLYSGVTCVAKLNVKKVEPWGESKEAQTYSVTGFDTADCK